MRKPGFSSLPGICKADQPLPGQSYAQGSLGEPHVDVILPPPIPPTPTCNQSRVSRSLVGRVSRIVSALMTHLSPVHWLGGGHGEGTRDAGSGPRSSGCVRCSEVAQAPHGPRRGRKCRVSRSVVLGSLRPMDCVAHQAPLSMEFCRQEYCSWRLFPPPGGGV